MKKITAIVLVLCLAAGTALAGDYVRLGVDSLPTLSQNAQIPFYLERMCPEPEYLLGMSNGFVFTATGDAIWEYEDIDIDFTMMSWFNLGIQPVVALRGSFPDTLLLGAAGMPPGGMPVLEDCLYFTLEMNIGYGEGTICVDSAFAFSAGAWKWSGLTCGLGGAPDRPLFVDKYESDENHPTCITVYHESPTEYHDHIRIGVDSLAAGTIRAELPFYVSRTCPVPNVVIAVSLGFELTATGDASWTYSDYKIGPIIYEWYFEWNPFVFTNRIDGIQPDSFLFGGAAMPPFGMPVTNGGLFFTVYLDIGPGEGELCIDSSFFPVAGRWMFYKLACGQGGAPDRPLFVAKDSSDANHPICITIYESLCGDLNLDGAVDVDDIVYLSQYVFGNQPMSIVLNKADVDCSGGVDIDDIVYLLNYVFGTGPEPCSECP